MGDYTSRKSKTSIGFLRRGSGISSRNRSPEERTIHNRDGPGSTAILNHTKTRLADNQERSRYLCHSFKSSSSLVMPGSSSKTPLRTFGEDKRKQPLVSARVDITESSSSRQAEAKHPESSKRMVAVDQSSDARHTEPEGLYTEQGQLVVPDPEVPDSVESSDTSAHIVESLVRRAALSSRIHKHKGKELILDRSGACSSPCTANRPRNPATDVKPPCDHVSGIHRRGLKNLGSTSVSDFLPSGCSSDFVHTRRFEAIRKGASYGESSARSRGLSEPASLSNSPPTYPAMTGPRIRTTEQAVSRRTIRSSHRIFQDSAVSVRTRRPPRGSSFRMSEEREDGMFALHESTTGNQQPDQVHLSLGGFSTESPTSTRPLELPHAIYSPSRQGSNARTARRRPSSHFEESPPQTFQGLLRERDGHRRITVEGIAEVLVALDMIEQGAELAYEQLLVLETNILLGSFTSHDEHRDMRMDIDNMSYEELLALEERIGSVSTALSEEQFVKCLRRSIYSPVATNVNIPVVDGIKCSICQEEYMEGEEVGRLGCEHRYHVCCIHQWLRQKSWCPICKAPAQTSLS